MTKFDEDVIVRYVIFKFDQIAIKNFSWNVKLLQLGCLLNQGFEATGSKRHTVIVSSLYEAHTLKLFGICPVGADIFHIEGFTNESWMPDSRGFPVKLLLNLACLFLSMTLSGLCQELLYGINLSYVIFLIIYAFLHINQASY